MTRLQFWILAVAGALLIMVLSSFAYIAWRWQDREPVAALGWEVAKSTGGHTADSVTVTWLGITTLLFDDGETQILTDGTFSRPGLVDILSQRRVYSDVGAINYALASFRIDRLAAIIPLHSHFDHAMDIGHVANRTSAIILGSESTANIALGANVPVNQHQILASGEERQFGKFGIRLISSLHVPLGFDNTNWIAGTIDEPLVQPARIREWREGGSWSVLISHPQGTALVQGSGGFVADALPESSADVVMLSVAGLSRLGRDYVREYWSETVIRSGATSVFPMHFEDFTRPFGEVALFPRIVDDVVVTAGWIDELAAESADEIIVRRLPLGQPVAIFSL